MAKSENQKLKIFYILDYLQRNSHQDHPVRAAELLSMLERQHNIVCDRKTVYSDIAALQDYGVDIVSIPGKNGGYYIASRNFELPELKLLIDGVLCSQHINPRQSSDLIEKLCKLSNKYFRSHVKNIHTVKDWNKTENVAVFYNIEIIDEATKSFLNKVFHVDTNRLKRNFIFSF